MLPNHIFTILIPDLFIILLREKMFNQSVYITKNVRNSLSR